VEESDVIPALERERFAALSAEPVVGLHCCIRLKLREILMEQY